MIAGDVKLFSRYHFFGALLFVFHLPATWAGNETALHVQSATKSPLQVRRNFRDTSQHLVSYYSIVLEGSPQQIARLSRWLDEIIQVPHGRETLEAIQSSGNQVVIRHSDWALHASGRTLAPATDKLINGLGEDVEILFDVRIPEQGSHKVFDAQQRSIEFTAVQNLFHELAHARHLATGTWRYHDSEGQAIEEENRFRKQISALQGENKAVALRAGIGGLQIWWPAN